MAQVRPVRHFQLVPEPRHILITSQYSTLLGRGGSTLGLTSSDSGAGKGLDAQLIKFMGFKPVLSMSGVR